LGLGVELLADQLDAAGAGMGANPPSSPLPMMPSTFRLLLALYGQLHINVSDTRVKSTLTFTSSGSRSSDGG
jgi:hypothetical protein